MRFTHSLKKYSEFKNVYRHGKSTATGFLVLYVLRSGLRCNRLGVTVSKKVGGSVIRSRVTRLIKENYRLAEGMVSSGFDLVFVARNSAAGADFWTIQASVRYLLAKRGLTRLNEEILHAHTSEIL